MLERISKRFIERHPLDAVRIIEHLTDTEKSALITSLEHGSAANVLQAMSPADAVSAISGMTPMQSISILRELSPNFAAGCMRRLHADIRDQILKEAEQNGDLKGVRTLLHFPPGVVGGEMNPETAAVQEQMTAEETIGFVRRHPDKVQNIIYVVNEENKLTGMIEARDLLLLNDNTLIKSCIKPIRYKLNSRVSLDSTREYAGWEHMDIMPVVDYHGIYLGSLTRESLLQALADIESIDIYRDQPKDILIGLAETFLNTCSELLFPNRK